MIVYSNRDSIDSIMVAAGSQLQNRFGIFKHDAMVGTLFGSKVGNV